MNALADTRASVSVFTFSLYKNLGLGDPRPYHSNLTMAEYIQAKAIGKLRNVRIQIGYQAYLVDFLVLDISVNEELPLLLGHPFLRTYGAVIDMGSGTMSINDGVIHYTYFPKPKAKAYLEKFEIDEEDDWLSCFEVARDEDGNPNYGPMAPSFLDIEDEMERALAMEAYFNPFKNIIKLILLIEVTAVKVYTTAAKQKNKDLVEVGINKWYQRACKEALKEETTFAHKRMRIEQYIHMVDYSRWEVIENGNSPPITKVVEGVETVIAPLTAEEKSQRKLELKIRITLLMGIPNEHKLKFNSIKDAKSLLQAIEKSQPSSPQLVNEDLEQIHPDDLEAMDLKWQMVMLTMRDNKQKETTRRNVPVETPALTTFVSSDGLGSYDCSDQAEDGPTNFALMAYSSTSSNSENRENSKRTVSVEALATSALVLYDGLGGYDWSDQAEEGPTNFALMAYSSTSSNSEVSTDSNCSSSCLENTKILKEQIKQLLKDLRTSMINAITYKTGLESVEARL
nr:hypothetical protein [Tanacetum cinerariifolium]